MPDNRGFAEESSGATLAPGGSFERPEVGVLRLRPAATLPQYKTDLAAGMDLSACPEDGRSVEISAGQVKLIPAGIAVAIPPGFEGQVRGRSGLAVKHSVTVANSPGTIDADYRGELLVALINHGKSPFVVEPGMRIAQLVISPVAQARLVEVKTLDETRRGGGGFGSTGL